MTPEIRDALKSALGPKGWTEDPSEIAPYIEDWRGRYQGETPIMLTPGSTDEVAAAVKICAESGAAITPQGGNTGLVGGSTPKGEVLLSLRRMNAIRETDPLNDAITVEAGCVLTAVQDAAEEADRLFPLSLGAEGTATIGGLISTNAGGVAVLRYGMMRDLVLGIEAVLPDGRIWNGLRALRKDNTGYDLKQLFIGAEGTLGVVTAATLKVYPRPAARAVAFAGVGSIVDAVKLLGMAKKASGGAVTGFELVPRNGVELVLEKIDGTRDPLSEPHPWYCLVEMSFGRKEGAEETMEAALAEAFEAGVVQDAAIAKNETEAQDFWRIRETLPEAEKVEGGSIKHDISSAVSLMPELYERAAEKVRAVTPDARLIVFGHVGDGNLHFNVRPPAGEDDRAFFEEYGETVRAAVHEAVGELNGSISAEHGIGVMKRDELPARKSPVEMDMLRAVKRSLDPNNIMNPRVMLTD